MNWLGCIIAAVAATFVGYSGACVATLRISHWRAERRFRRYLAELEREADALIAANTLRHMVSSGYWRTSKRGDESVA